MHWTLILNVTCLGLFMGIYHLSEARKEDDACRRNFSIQGLGEENVKYLNDRNIKIKYFVRTEDYNRSHLYAIKWDDDIDPIFTSNDPAFAKFFRVNKSNNTWTLYLKQSLGSQSLLKTKAVANASFEIEPDFRNCTVILEHYFINSGETRHNVLSIEEKENRGTGNETRDTLYHSVNEIEDLPRFLAENNELGPNSTTSPSSTTTKDTGNHSEVNFRITVGIIGGFLGLMFIIGIAVGIYYNQKKGVRLGLFKTRQKPEKKTISILGAAYPNIAMSNPDIRTSSNAADQSADNSAYPNYAYANPVATEPVPSGTSLYDSVKLELEN